MKPFILLLLALFSSHSYILADASHLDTHVTQEVSENSKSSEISETEEKTNTAKITEDSSEEDPTETIRYRTIKFSGKFHPIVVHFPIAFLLGAFLMQWAYLVTKKPSIQPIVTTMLWMGALGAIGAATLGWAYAYDSMYFGEEDIQLLKLHRWIGTGTAVAAVVTLILKRFLNPTALAILLTALAGLVGATGHYGGSLTYGSDNFSDF